MSTIKLKTGSGAPTAADLVQGEPALDLTNKRLYTEDASGSVIEVGTNPGVDVTFADNRKAVFGAGSDLEIYHDGSNSYIDDTGTGTLRIRGHNQIRVTDTSDNLAAIFKGDAESTLYHNNSAKLATSATGIDVTGTAVTDGLTSDGVATVRVASAGATAEGLTVYNTENANNSQVDVYFGSNDYDTAGRGLRIEAGRDSGADGIATFYSVDQAEHSDYEAIKILTDGGVTLSHLGSNKLATTATGIDVTGTVTVNGLTVDGVSTLNNHVKIANGYSLGWDDITTRITGNSSTDLMQHYTAGVQRMRIASNGDISFYDTSGTSQSLFWDASAEALGIGTSSPDGELHVEGTGGGNGDVYVERTSGAKIHLQAQSATGIIGTTSNHDLAFKTNDSQRMRIDSSGNVGIGTTSPSETLHVNAGNNNDVATFESTDSNAKVNFKDSTSTSAINTNNGNMVLNCDLNDEVADSFMAFRVDNDEKMRIEDTGRVGIGTDSPEELLHLSDTGGNAVLKFTRNDTTTTSGSSVGTIQFAHKDADDAGVAASIAGKATNAFGKVALTFATGNPTTKTERMRLDADGNLGIGTSSPSFPLEVDGGTGDGIKIKAGNTSNDDSFLVANSSDTTMFVVDGSGNLLVGTTNVNPAANNVTGHALKAGGLVEHANSGAMVMRLNRTDSVGSIIEFRQGTTPVGDIGTRANYIKIGNGDTQLLFNSASDAITPEGATDNRDGFIDLGRGVSRFKSICLSNGVQFGTTDAAAQLLDDYEEGTFTITLRDATSGGNASSTTANGSYTKVGRLVTCSFNGALSNINTTGMTGANTLYMDLPFTKNTTVEDVGVMVYDSLDTGSLNASIQNVVPETVSGSSNVLQFRTYGDNIGDNLLKVQDITSGTTDFIRLTITYQAA